MSASFPLRASKSDDLFFKINCHRERSVAISYCIANCTRLPLSLLSSQRRLLRYSASAVDDHVITSDRRERGDLMMIRQKHEIATFATLFATESTATSTRE
jgi:hypothetical protein